jgi:hypothetical protein
LEYLNLLAKGRFWGSINLKFESGLIVHLKKEESLKPSELLSGYTGGATCKKEATNLNR